MDYVGIPILIFFYLIWKIMKRTKFIPLADMDLDTGRKAFDDMSEEWAAKRAATGPQPWYMRIWNA